MAGALPGFADSQRRRRERRRLVRCKGPLRGSFLLKHLGFC